MVATSLESSRGTLTLSTYCVLMSYPADDFRAKYLRQTILLSRFDSPDCRAIFNRFCQNLQGKIRLERNDFLGLMGQVRPGVRQVFERFDSEGAKGLEGDAAVDEVEQRLDWFIKKVDLQTFMIRLL